MIYKYLVTMDDCNNDNSCLLQYFHKINKSKYTLENTVYCNYSRQKSFVAFGGLIGNYVKIFQHNNTASNNSPV